MENNKAEQKKGRRIREHENRLREFSDSIKCTNIRVIGIPEEARERGQKTYLKK